MPLAQDISVAAVDIVAACVKLLSLIAVLQATGVSIFLLFYRRHLVNSLPFAVKLGAISAGIGVVLTAAYPVFGAARMAGEFSGVWDESLELLSWNSSNGVATLVRVLGLLTIVVGLKRDSFIAGAIGITSIVVSFVLIGHTTTHSPRFVLAALLSLHVAVVAFWFGALPLLLIASKREASVQCIAAFSKHAALLVPCLAIAGVAMAWVFLPNYAALATPYGLSLVVKLNAFILLMALAALNKLRLVPKIERRDTNAVAAFGRIVKIEYAVIVVVLCATALMTTLFSPE